MKAKNILVVGAGVIGLTTAIKLLELGYEVTIFAKDLSPNNCSDIACAIWEPYLCEPLELVKKWAAFSLEIFRDLCKNDPKSGCTLRKGYMLSKQPIEIPYWLDKEMKPREITKDNDKDDVLGKKRHDFYDYAVEYYVPCIDVTIFNPWLLKKFLKLGGKLQLKELKSFNLDINMLFDVIINCTGLGASKLCPNDKDLYPRRGQLVCMKVPDVEDFYTDLDIEEPGFSCYIVPRNKYLVLGGTRKFNIWDTEPNYDDAKKIINLCSKMLPQVSDTPVLSNIVGLRPGRTEVRIELEMGEDNTPIIHNYGHGGAGVTLSFGCAEEVAKMVMNLTRKSKL